MQLDINFVRKQFDQLQYQPYFAELTIGPSTSMNTYVMSQAIGDQWQSGYTEMVAILKAAGAK